METVEPRQVTQARRPTRVSAAAVARAAGVSTATVSYVMNGKVGVSSETRTHVLAVARELGFTPRRGEAVDPGRSRVIALVQPNIVNPTYPRFAQAIITAGAAVGYQVFIATTQDQRPALEHITATLVNREVDGVILSAAFREDASALRTLRAARIPYVYLSRRSLFLEGDFAGVDDAAAAEELMEHVLGHGHTDVATVVGPRFSSASSVREESFVRTAERHGVRISGARKISTELDNNGGRRAAQRLFSLDTPPRAVVCGSDEMAIGVMEFAVEHGIRIPEDVAVTGCDGTPHYTAGLINLTTIVQPHEEMAAAAFGMLMRRIERPALPRQERILPHRLHLGRTCGCAAVGSV
ncbi:LacI family DNA-binding transcriptional regulator [Streptomyces sp. NPDC001661]